jgi:hypothetical protein
MEGAFSSGVGYCMEKAKDKLLDGLSYFPMLTIAVSLLAIASMGGYLYGSAQTAISYDAVFQEFIDNVETRQVFYFRGYKVVPKEKVVVVKVKPQQLAELAEAREAALGKNTDQDVSDRTVVSGQPIKTSASAKTITRSASVPF